MNLPFRFALRYIFSKKSTNVINLISGISVFGITLGSMALIVILSVFNGFEDLLRDLISSFKPDLHISAVEGKVFVPDQDKIKQLSEIEGVEAVTKTLTEIALFEYDGLQNLGMMKGVDDAFLKVIAIDTTVQRGQYRLGSSETDADFGVLGATLEHTLQIGTLQSSSMTVYMPKREKEKFTAGGEPFRKQRFFPTAIYSVKQLDYDNCAIVSLKFAQKLLAYKEGEISALELKLDPEVSVNKVQAEVKAIMGDAFAVKNRYEQDEAFFKITNLEKWVGFLIFAFTLVLVAFNMVGALWMLVLEKRKDIAHLKAMGASNSLVRNIFLAEGALMSIIGVSVGCVLAAVLCLLQQQFGLVQLEGADSSFVVQAYPVAMRFSDFVVVILTVLIIGSLAALLPAMRAARIKGLVRQA
jgi:lipoprotein-releasing system permease protein